MKQPKSHIAIIALLYLISGVMDLWVGLSMILLHIALWVVLRFASRGLQRSHHEDEDFHSDRLASAVREHHIYKVEGEIFGLNKRLQEAVIGAVKTMDTEERDSTSRHVRVIPIILSFLGLQTLVTLSILAQTTTTIDPWAILLVIAVPFITYQLTQEHVISDGRDA